MIIKTPYLLYIGDATDPLSIKMANGVATWCPEKAVGECVSSASSVSTGLPRLDIPTAAAKGAKSLVISFNNAGGTIDPAWLPDILQAIDNGMDIISGLHQKLTDIKVLTDAASKAEVALIDIRHPTTRFNTGTGQKRSGKRLLTVGTDCSVGKMYTALALERALKSRGADVTFRATGQCGIVISERGVAVDCVISDFIAGAVEQLAPANSQHHWDIIEGQGSLFHPAFAGVSLGLLHGAQPDAMVLCHAENRASMRGITGRALPSIEQTIELNVTMARMTNPSAKFVGIAINTSSMSETDALALCQRHQQHFALPCTDPLRFGVDVIIDTIIDGPQQNARSADH